MPGRVRLVKDIRIKIKKRLIIELITGIGLLASSLTLTGDKSQIQSYNDMVNVPVVKMEGKITESPRKKNTEELVKEYFADTPDLISVAWCESRFRQFDQNGEVVRGEVNPSDVGVTQINTYFHEDAAEKLGMDLYTLEGNAEYAKYLYRKEGLTPWKASSPCWNKLIGSNEVAMLK